MKLISVTALLFGLASCSKEAKLVIMGESTAVLGKGTAIVDKNTAIVEEKEFKVAAYEVTLDELVSDTENTSAYRNGPKFVAKVQIEALNQNAAEILKVGDQLIELKSRNIEKLGVDVILSSHSKLDNKVLKKVKELQADVFSVSVDCNYSKSKLKKLSRKYQFTQIIINFNVEDECGIEYDFLYKSWKKLANKLNIKFGLELQGKLSQGSERKLKSKLSKIQKVADFLLIDRSEITPVDKPYGPIEIEDEPTNEISYYKNYN